MQTTRTTHTRTHTHTLPKKRSQWQPKTAAQRESNSNCSLGERAREWESAQVGKRAHECQNNNEHKYPRRTSKQHNKLRLCYAQVTHDRQRLRLCRADEGGSTARAGAHSGPEQRFGGGWLILVECAIMHWFEWNLRLIKMPKYIISSDRSTISYIMYYIM